MESSLFPSPNRTFKNTHATAPAVAEPYKLVSFTLVQSHQDRWNLTTLSPEAVRRLWGEIPPFAQDGRIIYSSVDGRQVGHCLQMTLIDDGGDNVGILVEAMITDDNLLQQPWLQLDQIARASLIFDIRGNATIENEKDPA